VGVPTGMQRKRKENQRKEEIRSDGLVASTF